MLITMFYNIYPKYKINKYNFGSYFGILEFLNVHDDHHDDDSIPLVHEKCNNKKPEIMYLQALATEQTQIDQLFNITFHHDEISKKRETFVSLLLILS